MKLITKDTDYAMRALAFMAGRKNTIFSVSEISSSLGISKPFLRKLLQLLGRKGIVTSAKGRDGGFRMRKDPSQILLTDLISIFQGDLKLSHCTVREEKCPNRASCLLARKLSRIEDLIQHEIGSITIGSLNA